MAADEQTAMNEVIQMMETEPSSSLGNGQPDIPVMREQLAILVSTGKAKEAMGVQLTKDQVKRLEEKDVERYYKRYETYVGATTTETIVDNFLSLYGRAAAMFVRVKDAQALQNDLKKDYVVTKDLPTAVKSLALRCGRLLMVANMALIITKHTDFSPVFAERSHPSRDAN